LAWEESVPKLKRMFPVFNSGVFLGSLGPLTEVAYVYCKGAQIPGRRLARPTTLPPDICGSSI